MGRLEAQVISGRVERDGAPVPGAAVKEKKSRQASLTDSEGRFSVRAQAGDSLSIQVGDTLWRVAARRGMAVDLAQLAPRAAKAAARRGEPTVEPIQESARLGAITAIEAADFNQGNIFDPYALIQGRVPGLHAARPGGDPLAQFDVRLRGMHGLHSMVYNYPLFDGAFPLDRAIDLARPLFVVDGLPSASLLSVDPANIARITVLRDAASAARYGARGANGVVLVETRNGAPGPLLASYQAGIALDRAASRPEVFSAGEFRRLINTPGTVHYRPEQDFGASTDWLDEITRPALSHAHRLGLSGGDEATQYSLALNYRNVQGVALHSGFGQWNIQARLRRQFWGDRLSLGANGGFTQRDFQDLDPIVFRQAAIFNPTAPVRDPAAGDYFQRPIFNNYNPAAILEQTLREGDQRVRTVNLDARLRPVEGLEAWGQYVFQDHTDNYGLAVDRDAFYLGAQSNGATDFRARKLDNQFIDAGLAYGRTLAKHSLRAQAGYQHQRWRYRGAYVQASNFIDDNYRYDQVSGAETIQRQRYRADDELLAYRGSLSYDFAQTFFLEVGMRFETASRFGPERKWADYPYAQSGLSLHRLFDWRHRLHLRGGFGVAGQLPPKNYAAFTRIVPGPEYYFNGAYQPSFVFANTANPAIAGERRAEWNLGLDLTFWNDRAALSLDIYDSRSTDLAQVTTIPSPPNPHPSFTDNIGALRNRGWEANVTLQVLSKERFTWNFALVAFAQRTEVMDLAAFQGAPNAQIPSGQLGGPGACCVQPQQLKPNAPLGAFYALRNLGVNDGRWQFADLNGDGVIDASDYYRVGDAQPSLSLGWRNQFRWGRFDADFLLRALSGHRMINAMALFHGSPTAIGMQNALRSSLEGEIAQLREFTTYSDYYVENASFMRLDFISLGYRPPLAAEGLLSNLRLTLVAQNLFTISGYSGADPELRFENSGNPLAPGIDGPNLGVLSRHDYFPARTIFLGLNVGF
jgi:TonB-linked SusC/RagA family outer membrane protein